MYGRILACLFLIALAPGCRSTVPKSALADAASPQRILLKNFVDYFSTRVGRAADLIAQQQKDPSISRNTVYWKLRMIPMAQRAMLLADNQAAAMQLWLLAAAQDESVSGEFGAQLMGDGHSIAAEATKEIRDDARDLAGSLLTKEQFQAAEPRIEEFVKNHVGKTGLEMKPEDVKTWTRTMSSVLQKPFDMIQAPLSSLNPVGGLSDTALAIQNFTDEFTLARMDMDYMPSELRWNAQLLVMELEETVRASELAHSMVEIGASATSLAETAKTLPAELRGELASFAEDLDKNQASLMGMLGEVNTTITDTGKTAQALDAMGTTFIGMFEGFDRVMATFGMDPDAPPAAPDAAPTKPADEGPPFDINDYGRTAEKLTGMAEALTALLAEADGIAKAQQPPALLVDSEAMARSIVDRVLLGAAALVLFTALVAYAYRVAVGRLKRS